MATLNAVIKALDDAGIKPAADKARAVEIRLQSLESDPRLNDNFETALSALIEHHGADALASLAAVMRHYNIEFHTVDGITIRHSDAGIVFDMDKSEITANDIKPEK